ncbi:translocation protein SEC63 homolog [Culicoides brevitarsis]|uniref:translocation protein SEC63 homolog n=1 Tax=Culicoides brevitarsis TaxID=469753 RepID=UPI00307BBA5B
MAGQKFEYDETGKSFLYFILSFLALILIPSSFYLWPKKQSKEVEDKDVCQCEGCVNKRLELTKQNKSHVRSFFIKTAIIVGWIIFALVVYKVSQFDYELANFDPYEIMGVPPGATTAEIRKMYKKMSLVLHPDKETGDEKKFMMLTKAYQALTDPEARKNWEKYGNPDGPGAMSFGIALPSWIVEKDNSVYVLGLYALVFMVALPVAVGTWWYRSIRFSGDKVLLDTTQMYFYFFHKTPMMAMKRVIMILAASLEFDKRHNSQVVERQSDNDEVPQLIKQLPNLNEKCKEMPLCRTYSIKTRAILHAHLSRIPLNPETLDKDRQFILKKCPYLIQEMVSCVNQLIILAYARRISKLPHIETIENCMKLSPLIVQGLWEFKSPLLQLPYLTDDNLRYFVAKKRPIRTLQQFAQLSPEETRSILRNLTETEYENVMKALGNMPVVDFSIRCEVVDDDNTNVVTAGAIVTVTVFLKRRNMSELFGASTINEKALIKDASKDGEEATGEAEEGDAVAQKPKKPVWMKSKGGKGGKSKSKGSKPKVKAAGNAATTTTAATTTPNTEKKSKKEREDSDDETSESENEEEERKKESTDDEKKSNDDDDDLEWEKFQKKLNKKEKLEGKSKVSHSVHSPLFPEDKQEYWWTYICDRKSGTLLTAPYHVTNLVDYEEVQLKFTAPRWAGVYTFNVCLRSDSYLGMDQQLDLKLDVKEATAIPTELPEWDLSESEAEQHDEQANESEFTTDSSDAEDD